MTITQLTDWLARNGNWIVPLTAIIGTATATFVRIWQISRNRSNDKIILPPTVTRILRLCDLGQNVGVICIAIGLTLFVGWGISLPGLRPITLTNPVDWLGLIAISIVAISSLLILFCNIVHEWFRD